MIALLILLCCVLLWCYRDRYRSSEGHEGPPPQYLRETQNSPLVDVQSQCEQHRSVITIDSTRQPLSLT